MTNWLVLEEQETHGSLDVNKGTPRTQRAKCLYAQSVNERVSQHQPYRTPLPFHLESK